MIELALILIACIAIGVTISEYLVRLIDSLVLRYRNRERRNSVKRNKIASFNPIKK